MSEVTAKDGQQLPEAIEKALMEGDLSALSVGDRVVYYHRLCESLGLNPLTKPFEYVRLNGKLLLYARKECADQLRSLHKISIEIRARERIGDVYVVTARTSTKDGRVDESTGAVSVSGLRGDALANAFMKAETKAKRRGTLSICGLGMLDESEISSISSAVKVLENDNTKTHAAHPSDEYAPYDHQNEKMRQVLFKFLTEKNIDAASFERLSVSMNGRPYRLAEFENLLKENVF